MSHILKICTILLVINHNLSFSNETNWVFDHYLLKDGLSYNAVNSIVQDTAGFIWIGTDNGLNRFDGYSFTVFKHDPSDSAGISNNIITTLLVDQQNNVWIGTTGGGLNCFNQTRQTFIKYVHSPNDSSSLSNNMILSLMQDEDGRIWIGTERGLNVLDTSKKSISRYIYDPANPKSLSGNSITALHMDRNNRKWIGVWGGGLNKFDPLNQSFVHYKNPSDDINTIENNNIWNISEDRYGRLWIGYFKGGFDIFNPETNQIIHFYDYFKRNSIPGIENVRDIQEDNYGNTWIATDGGLFQFNITDHSFKRIMPFTDIKNIDIYNTFSCLFLDNTGLLWIGTRGNGLGMVKPITKKFRNLFLADDLDWENANVLNSIWLDEKKYVWLGTDIGLRCYKNDKDGFGPIKLPLELEKATTGFNISSLIESSKGDIYIGTWGNGLIRYNQKKERITEYRKEYGNYKSLNHNIILCLYEDNEGSLWIGTQNGLSRFNAESENFMHYLHDPNDPRTLSFGYVSAIFEDNKETLWIGTMQSGLNRFDKNGGFFVRYSNHPQDPKSLSNNRINYIFEDSKHQLWIGTHGGLNLFNRNSEKATIYLEKDGLSSDIIQHIFEDKKNNLWISTGKGISKLNLNNGKIRSYYLKDGIHGDEFATASGIMTNEGEIFFGGKEGLTCFFPEEIQNNPILPGLIITDLQVFNKSIMPFDGSGILEKHISYTKRIQLSHKHSVFSLSYVALSYINPEFNNYAYMLEGIDSDWNYVGNRRTVTYSTLNPGTYVFRVKASNNDGIWCRKPTVLVIEVMPPFWKTVWFKFTVFFIVSICLVGFYFSRINRIKRQKNHLEFIVGERTREISAQNTLLAQQKQQLLDQSRGLKKANYEIQKQNEELENQKNALELQAMHIEKMNVVLRKYNEKLTDDLKNLSKARVLRKVVSYDEFSQVYPTDDFCYHFLDELKWANGFQCKNCSHHKSTKDHVEHARRCTRCRIIESVTVDTIFYRLKIPIQKAFYLLFLVSSGKKTFARELAETLDISPQSCLSFRKKVFKAMEENKDFQKTRNWISLILEYS